MYTKEQYDSIVSAYAQGVTSVQFADKQIQYRSLREMKQIITEIESALKITKKINKKYINFSKGIK